MPFFSRALTPTMQHWRCPRPSRFPVAITFVCTLLPLPCCCCLVGSHFLPGIGDAQCHLNNNEIPQQCCLPPLYSRRSRFVIYCYFFVFLPAARTVGSFKRRERAGKRQRKRVIKIGRASGPTKRASMSKVQKARD